MMTPIEREIAIIGGTGMLTGQDWVDLQAATLRVRDFMLDGQWHTVEEIAQAAGQREGLRRLRALRKLGYVVEKRRDGSARNWLYRLTDATQKGATA